ncbi:MAG: extracellular solute-binding protein [Sphaerochaetaceae bacterium]|nr:extracellular solute-binding protein [Sphaerochaetaceae bacterium]MDC7238302.1 extracellular solute-binding protein [Sphaerochaetaceae bacterium]
MKKILSVFLILLFCSSVTLFASGSSEDENKVIEIWTQASADSREGQMFQAVVDKYNSEHPDGYQVEIQNITRAGAGSGYIDKLNAALTSNNMPEIFTLDGPDVASYADAGVIQPVESIIPQSFIDGFTASMIQQGTFNGEMYALGYQDSGVAIALNKNIIKYLPEDKKALIPDTDEDWTWDEMLEVARAINDLKTNPETMNKPEIQEMEVACDWLTSDITKGAYETGTYFLTPLLWANGGSLIGPDGLTLDGYFNSDENIEALTYLGKFFKEELVLPTEPLKAFYTQKAGMCILGFWFISEITANYPDLDYMTVRYPKVDESYDGLYTPSGSWAFVCSSSVDLSTDYGKAVGEVLQELTNDDSSRLYYDMNGAVPGRKNALDVIDVNSDDPRANEAWSVLAYEIANTNHARPVTKGYPVLSELWSKDVILAIAQAKTDEPEEIRAIVNKAMDKIQKEYDRF